MMPEVSGGPRFGFVVAPLRDEEAGLLACVHCGFCLNACPTYTRLGHEGDSPRGRLDLMRAVMEGRLPADDDAFRLHIDQCLGCRACEPVCPSGVPYGFLLERARGTIARATGVPWASRLLITAFTGPLRGVVGAGSRLFRATGLPAQLVRALPRRMGSLRFALAMLAASAPWRGLRTPLPPTSPVSPAAPAPPASPAAPVVPGSPERPPVCVAILTGCVQDALFGRVNDATRRVLLANGCTVAAAPGQRCCGALDAHSGRLEQALALARTNIAAFEAAGAEYVVVNAAGCGAMMKEYGEQLRHDPAWAERARRFSTTVMDAAEFLVARGLRPGAPVPLRVTFDAPCHLYHGQRIRQAPLQLLDAIPGLDRVPLRDADECCGGAGLYGVSHPELGGRILDDKIAAIRETGADAVATPNPGCMMQIGAGLLLHGRTTAVLHPLEILAESYRREDTG